MMVWQDEKNRIGGRDVVVLTLMTSLSGAIDPHGLSLKTINLHGLPLTQDKILEGRTSN